MGRFSLGIALLALLAVASWSSVKPVAASGTTAVSAGGYHTCAVTTTGGLKCWGYNYHGDLGNGTTTNTSTPTDVVGLTSGVAAVSAVGAGGGLDHTCAVTTTGGVKCWGYNANGQLGNGTIIDNSTPVNVSGLTSGAAAVSAGLNHTCALTTGGGVKCWGSNGAGELGDGQACGDNTCPTPVDVSGLTSGVVAVSVGNGYTCALTTAGGVKCWGSNTGGTLGDGQNCGTNVCLAPVNVTGLTSGVAALSVGEKHACALMAGAVKCWGNNEYGELGDGTTTGPQLCAGYSPCSTTPVNVSGLANGVAAVSAGGLQNTCALTTAGAVKCWGSNGTGQLGDGTVNQSTTPVDVISLTSGVAAVSGGEGHNCALIRAGGVKCWGYNAYGQLGDGTTSGPELCSPPYNAPCSTTPVDVMGLGSTDFKQDASQWNQTGQTYDHLSGGIVAWGCLLSSVADVLNYWGVPTDPVALNNAMVAAGWPDGMMNPKYVISYSHLPVLRTLGYDPVLATSYLSRPIPVPVIVHLNSGGDGHWVVLTGLAPGGDFYILDPNSTRTLLSQYTPSQAHWLETWVINGGASVGAEAHSPVAMLLTDPLGRRTGYDPSTATVVNEIPSSAYGLMGGIENDVTNTDGTPGLLSVYTNAPVPGTYTLQITGTGTGPYRVDAWSSTADGALTSSSSQGNATLGSSTSITLNVQGVSVGGITSLIGVALSPDRTASRRSAALPFAALAILGLGCVGAGGIWYARRGSAR